MTAVGFVGLGKLGLPVAYCIAAAGLDVYGFDPFVQGPPFDLSTEEGYQDIIARAEDRMHFCAGPDEVIASGAEVVFVAVQTPHEPRFEGVTPLPHDRADFNYTYLVDAVSALDAEATLQRRDVTLAVISTVLPGTMERYVLPILGPKTTLVYCPQFIAMGTTIRDYTDPEFVLIGGDREGKVEAVYNEVYPVDPERFQYGANYVRTTVKNAELIKVAYNTFIGLKIAFANTVMEVCDKTGCDVDEVTGALKQAHRRLISPAYLDGGMGDGGACHPRDNIALSWLARKLDLSYDLFESAMVARERQAEWLCDLVEKYADGCELSIGLLGVAYKPGSHLTDGSPALLCKDILVRRKRHVTWSDPHVGGATDAEMFRVPRVFLVGCKHPEFADQQFPEGSVVIDPFRYIADRPGIAVVRVGEGD